MQPFSGETSAAAIDNKADIRIDIRIDIKADIRADIKADLYRCTAFYVRYSGFFCREGSSGVSFFLYNVSVLSIIEPEGLCYDYG